MGRTCLTCAHEDRLEIDRAVVGGIPMPVIARRYGLSPHAVKRHAAAHLSPALIKAAAHREEQVLDGMLDRVHNLLARTEAIYDAAEEESDRRDMLAAIRELTRITELLGRVTGELDERPQTTVNILVTEDWIQLRSTLLRALDPYPSAKVAVAEAVLALEAPKGNQDAS